MMGLKVVDPCGWRLAALRLKAGEKAPGGHVPELIARTKPTMHGLLMKSHFAGAVAEDPVPEG